MICSKCGAENDATRRFCTSCGNPLTETAASLSKAAEEAQNIQVTTPQSSININKALESAKSVAGTVAERVGDIDFDKLKTGEALRPAGRKAKDLLSDGLSFLKHCFTLKPVKLAIWGIVAAFAVGLAGFGVSAFAGREIMQAVQGDDYARSFLLSQSKSVVNKAIDTMEDMTELYASSGSDLEIKSTAEWMVDAKLPEDYVGDLLYHFDGYSRESFEVMRLLGASRIDLRTQIDTSRKVPAATLGGKWKLDGKDIVDADISLYDDTLYISAPKLYSETVALDLGYSGFSGLDAETLFELLASQSYGYGSGYMRDILEADVDRMVSKLRDYLPKLKPVAAMMLEAGIDELDLSVLDSEIVDVNGKTVELDAVVVEVTQKDLMMASAAMLEALLDDRDSMSLLVSIIRDFAQYAGGESVSMSMLEDQLEYIIEDIRRSDYYDDSDVQVIYLYVDNGNNLCGFSVDTDDGDNMSLVFLPGTGYEYCYADMYTECRVYGDLRLGLSLGGDVNVYYMYDGDEMEGKICDFSLKPSVKNPELSLKVKASDIMDMLENGADGGIYGMESALEQLDFFRDTELELSVKASKNSADYMVKLSDPVQKATLTSELSMKMNQSVSIGSEPRERAYDPMSFMSVFDYGEFMDNVDDIADSIDRMGYDISWLTAGISNAFRYW